MPDQRTARWNDKLILWELLLRHHRRATTLLDAELRRTRNLTLEEYDVVHQLASAPVSMRMGSLSAALLLAPSSCHRVVSKLEARGFLTRTAAVEDRRAINVTLTSAGRRAHRTAALTHTKGIDRVLGDRLSRNELTLLTTGVRTLLDELDAIDNSSSKRERPTW